MKPVRPLSVGAAVAMFLGLGSSDARAQEQPAARKKTPYYRYPEPVVVYEHKPYWAPRYVGDRIYYGRKSWFYPFEECSLSYGIGYGYGGQGYAGCGNGYGYGATAWVHCRLR
jgi:hypothetical protein